MKFEINNELPDIPENVKKWAEDSYFGSNGYIYYRKKGRHVKCFCSACGGEYEGITELSPDIDGFCENLVYPEHNKEAKCKLCGNMTLWKAAGMQKRPYYSYGTYEFVQKQGDHIVWRTVGITMTLRANEKTVFEHSEYSRLYMKNGEGYRRLDKCYSWYNNERRWRELKQFHPCKYSGKLYPGSAKVLKNHFKYIPAPKGVPNRVKEYYSAAAKYKDFEMVKKLGLEGLERYMCNSFASGLKLNLRAKTVDGRLRINKSRLKDLVAAKGDIEILKAYQTEKRIGKKFTKEDIDSYCAMRRALYGKHELEDYEFLLTMYRPGKIWEYTESQRAKSKRYMPKSFYFDYIRMRREMGYDLTNEIFAFPKDLNRRHDELVAMKEKKVREGRITTKNIEFAHIAENYKKLSRKYNYTAAGFIIRPAMSAGEIIEEGAKLHHCVGSSDTYMSNHNKGDAFILFLRKETKPDKPYITVEITSSGKIRQWFGAHDTKPNKKNIDEWLKDYCDMLNKPKKAKTA